ncbi:hypothetical protein GJ744_006712 [Endocarpon pusillum]|uniref:Nephrocystin 3-like N-terminal domain-containing protein n=1 Tax=Endocarpon pusillum TaxID=364733 RepID=A0A8H7E6W3_9EURO|nr:hypothetical protein GJ744_006712 [Endocarpon pusillum]
MRYKNEQERQCHQSFACIYEQYKDVNPGRVLGTCKWVLDHPQFQAWQRTGHNDLLWISADPGCGKSVLSKFLVDHEFQTADQITVCYFFFKDNELQDNLAIALRALLHQLFSHQPQLLHHAISM